MRSFRILRLRHGLVTNVSLQTSAILRDSPMYFHTRHVSRSP